MKKYILMLIFTFLVSCSLTDTTINSLYVVSNNGFLSKDSILDFAIGISKIQKKYIIKEGYVFERKEYKDVKYIEYNKKDTKSENLVLLVHGGAFKLPFNQIYVTVMEHIIESTDKTFESIMLDYTTGKKYPTQSKELETLLEYAKTKYKKIILVGDSSGGNVILSVMQKLRDENKELIDGLVLMSPWGDLTNTVESRKRNYYKDILFGNEMYPKAMIDNDYISEVKDLKNPYVSPVFGVYHNFPKTLIQVGRDELLLDDSNIIYEKMKKANVNVKLVIFENMFHVFHLLPVLPETKLAYSQVGEFIESVF